MPERDRVTRFLAHFVTRNSSNWGFDFESKVKLVLIFGYSEDIRKRTEISVSKTKVISTML